MSIPQVIDVADVPPVTSRGGKLRVFASPKTIGTKKLIMGSASLKAGEKIRKHTHDYGEEIVLVVKGKGTVAIEDEEFKVKAGNVFIARQGQSHEVRNDESEDLELIFSSAPLAPSQEQGHRDI